MNWLSQFERNLGQNSQCALPQLCQNKRYVPNVCCDAEKKMVVFFVAGLFDLPTIILIAWQQMFFFYLFFCLFFVQDPPFTESIHKSLFCNRNWEKPTNKCWATQFFLVCTSMSNIWVYPQFYIQLVNRPHFGTWILLLWPFGQSEQ